MRCVKRMSSHTLFTFAKFKLRATEKLAPVSNGTTMGSKACKENKPARSSILAKPPLSMDLMREKQASFVKESDGVKSQIIPLKCPLTMTRIRIPVRFMSCKHLSCFDLDSYIAAETNKSTQKCPICNCTGSPSALRMCGFTYWMLEHNPDCTHYELTSDFIRPVDKVSHLLRRFNREVLLLQTTVAKLFLLR
ncbi:E3 SUMO-protein ligase PIAS1-like isoform X3 [Varroa destructor]|uniref:SP-RING-type domain-containing protein n=1 Tax=Varroa destructor TaxID=109461 RepID=A0A7M7JNX9_VARDE|nr:E3 SUMO-protein ligase PIAS1-like isoform X3 [Varroa destructor]